MSTNDDDLIRFASIDHRARRGAVFGIRSADLLRHVYVIGKTGSGKSALLERFALTEIRAGRGCAVLDPHGDLATRLLDLIPRERTNDVIVFDPSDVDRPIGLNVLERVEPERRVLVAAGVLSVFRKAFAEFWGPRLEHVFRNALLALLEVRGTTLLSLLRMLVDDVFRARIVRQVHDPVVRFFWEREFTQYPAAFLAEMLAPVQNKVAAVLTSPMLRNIVGQHRTALDLRAVMNDRRVLIANLAKGRIGEDASALLGAILVTRIQLAAYSRADVDPSRRTPFTLIADEFSSFATRSFCELLAEARKYGLALVLAHQHLGQLDDGLRRAVFGNVGTMIAFRLGAEDAQVLGAEFEPEQSVEDLTRLGRHQIALRLCVDGETTAPFTAVTLPPPEALDVVGRGRTIIRASRARYGCERRSVERSVALQLEA